MDARCTCSRKFAVENNAGPDFEKASELDGESYEGEFFSRIRAEKGTNFLF
jgi:hypothetical protein